MSAPETAAMPDTNIPLEIGREYEVRHTRKGTFCMRVEKLYDCWISGVVTLGVATAVMSYNVKDEGDEITVRDTQSYFIPLKVPA
jgi:hypothetical protein